MDSHSWGTIHASNTGVTMISGGFTPIKCSGFVVLCTLARITARLRIAVTPAFSFFPFLSFFLYLVVSFSLVKVQQGET